MIKTICADERYHAETDWLSTHWHFSLDHYHDSANMHFGPLRVFHDDRVAPAGGFAFHSHREREIVAYIIDGALEHRDNMGNTRVIRPAKSSAGARARVSFIPNPILRREILCTCCNCGSCLLSSICQRRGSRKVFHGTSVPANGCPLPCPPGVMAHRAAIPARARYNFIKTQKSSPRCWPQANPPRTRSPKDGALIFS
jgi:hypothetical protein